MVVTVDGVGFRLRNETKLDYAVPLNPTYESNIVLKMVFNYNTPHGIDTYHS